MTLSISSKSHDSFSTGTSSLLEERHHGHEELADEHRPRLRVVAVVTRDERRDALAREVEIRVRVGDYFRMVAGTRPASSLTTSASDS